MRSLPILSVIFTLLVFQSGLAQDQEFLEDTYQDNGLSRADLFQELVRLGYLMDEEAYHTVGRVEGDVEAETLYDDGERQVDFDFFERGRFFFTRFWTARTNGNYVCFRLHHKTPGFLPVLGLSKNWCVYPDLGLGDSE